MSEEEATTAEPLATDQDLVAAMQRVAANRALKKELEERVKTLNKDITADQDRILATFDARGIDKMRVVGAGLFYVQQKAIPKVHDKDGLICYLDRVGEGALAPRTVNPATLKKFWNETMERGGELPTPDVAEGFILREIRVRKA